MEELKPCPFCGGSPNIRNRFMDSPAWCAECSKCSCVVVDYANTREDAVSAWNRRVDNDRHT